MAKQVWGRHTKHLTTSQDNTKEISTNEWNDNINRKGHFGFDAITIASASTITPPAFSTTVGNQPSSLIKLSGSTSVDTIAITNTDDGDLLYVVTTGSVTLNNTSSPSSAGDIRLLGNANKDLDTNVPTILIRSGNYWYEYGGSPVTDASITFAKIQNLATMKVIGRTASGSGVSSEVTILDSDTMSGASDSTLATSESIKAYVDNNVSSVTASSTTTFTNKTIDADGTGNSITNIEDANIKASAAIDATKIANGTVTSAEFQYLGDVTSLIQAQIDGKSPTAGSSSLTTVGTVASGIWEATDVAVAHGGTGSSTASAARTALGVAIGSDVQAFDAQLTDVAGLAVTDGNFIVGDGSNFVAESGSTARTSLGLGTIATQAANSVDIDGGAIDGAVIGANSAAAITGTTITGTQVDITAEGDLRLQDASGGQYVGFEAPATVSASYTLEMPAATGASGKVLKMSSSANVLEWGDAGGAAGNTIDTLLRDEADSDPSYTSRTENSASTPIQIWSKTLDSNNENLYVRVKKNGSYTNVQIA